MKKDWFAQWFESVDYLNLYRHRTNEEAETFISTILKATGLNAPAKVLDSACGAGRYSIAFAKMGFDVTGFDLSRLLLEHAVRQAKEEGVNIDFFRSDIREVKLSGKFDLALNVFTSFGYFESEEENFQFFKNAFDHLVSGGFFVFDYFNSRFLTQNLVPKSQHVNADGKIIEMRRIENNRVVKEIRIQQNGVSKEFVESVQIYSGSEIIDKCSKIGYKLITKFGNYNGAEFKNDSSERFIAIFQKL